MASKVPVLTGEGAEERVIVDVSIRFATGVGSEFLGID